MAEEEKHAEFLPDISSSKNSQKRPGSARRLADGRATEMPRASGSGHSKALKSFQLAEEFQADQIIGGAAQSQRSARSRNGSRSAHGSGLHQGEPGVVGQSDGRQIEDADIDVQAYRDQAQATTSQPIDFHGVNGALSPETANGGSGSQTGNSRSRQRASERALGQHSSRSQRGGTARQQPKTPSSGVPRAAKVNAWEHFEVNQFKVRNQDPGQLIDKLKELTAAPIPFQSELPAPEELDSTDPLDSFMVAFNQVTADRSTDFTPEVQKGIHLATGTRTEYCEALLAFICHHQKLEIAFGDSVEFFMESLTSLVQLEAENRSMKQNVSHLLNLKEDGIVQKYSLV